MTSCPSVDAVKEVVTKANSNATTVVPVWKEWSLASFSDIGPEEAYLAVSKGVLTERQKSLTPTGIHSMLFECSLESDPKVLLHSIIATDPWKVMTSGTAEGQLGV